MSTIIFFLVWSSYEMIIIVLEKWIENVFFSSSIQSIQKLLVGYRLVQDKAMELNQLDHQDEL
jgi:hypothetical protein